MTQNNHVAQIVKYIGILPEKSPITLSILKSTVNFSSNHGMDILRSIKTNREIAI